MKNKKKILIFSILLFLLLTNVCFVGCSCFGDTASWKEEVLLHDGSKIIVKRWQKHGGRHSLGDRPPVQEYTLKFKLPTTNETIIWKDGPAEDIDYANFDLLALHIKNNIPYLITSTHGCLSYNKWGRPNPPYVVLKYEVNGWKRIPFSELPAEFENINLVINAAGHEKELVRQDVVPYTMVKEINKSLTQKEYKTIVRTPMIGGGCERLFYRGRGSWMGLDFFEEQPNYEACLKACNDLIFDSERYCPCQRLFKTKTKEGK